VRRRKRFARQEIVLPKQKVSVNLIADNAGIWMLHCHNENGCPVTE
jgi:FtsP/CotA-like multicopper oxidase with cupredoxin domain